MRTRALRQLRRRRGSRGFSLLEMMAAMAIFSLVGLIIGTSLAAFTRSWRQAQKVGSELERNQAIDRVAETLFRGAVPFLWPDTDRGEDRYVFQGETDELYLTALGRTRSGADAFRFVRLYREGEELLCDWSTEPLLPWEDLTAQKYKTEKIASGVQEIYFKYAAEGQSDEAVDWYDDWDDEEQEGIPLAIQLTIEWRDGTRERWLRRTAGTSGNTALSVSGSSLSSGSLQSGGTGSRGTGNRGTGTRNTGTGGSGTGGSGTGGGGGRRP